MFKLMRIWAACYGLSLVFFFIIFHSVYSEVPTYGTYLKKYVELKKEPVVEVRFMARELERDEFKPRPLEKCISSAASVVRIGKSCVLIN